MKNRVTMRQIAEAAGVHFTTVSRALRNHPALPQATRERIQSLATQMGYLPDPALSALNNYRVTRRRMISYQGTIAWLDGLPAPGGMLRISQVRNLYESACQRAAQLGYNIETISLGSQEPQRLAQLDRQLRARGIRNLVVSTQLHPYTSFDLNWDNYSAVSVSPTFVNPYLCSVINDHYSNAALLTRQLRRIGYRRIGLLLENRLLEITERRWLAGYLVERDLNAPEPQPDLLYFDDNIPDSALRDWYQRNRPDAIISEPAFVRKRLQPLLKIRIPQDVAFGYLSLQKDSPEAGILENQTGVGGTAIDQLVKMDQHNERGLLRAPVRISIQGQWKTGNSVHSGGVNLRKRSALPTTKTLDSAIAAAASTGDKRTPHKG